MSSAVPHSVRPDESAAIPSPGQEAVVAPALAAAEHLDQLAQLVPDIGAPPVPTAAELAALPPDTSADPSASPASAGEGTAPLPSDVAPSPADVAPSLDHPSDPTGGFAGHVYVTASPLDPGASTPSFDGPALHLSDGIVSPNFSPATTAPLFPQHTIPQDHELVQTPPTPPTPSAPVADVHPPVASAHAAAPAATHATGAVAEGRPLSAAGTVTITAGGGTTSLMSHAGVASVSNFDVGGHLTIASASIDGSFFRSSLVVGAGYSFSDGHAVAHAFQVDHSHSHS